MSRTSTVNFEALLNALPVSVFRVNRDYRIDYVNDFGAEQYGLSPEEIVGRSCSELGMPPDLYAKWHEELDKVFAGAGRGEFEYFRTYTDPPRLIEFQIAPERDAAGRVGRVLVAMLHIDKVHELRRTLDAQEELFRHFMDHSPVIAWLRDEESRYCFLNQPYLDRYRRRSDEVLGRRPDDVWPAAVAERFLANDHKVRTLNAPLRSTVDVPDADGSVRQWLDVQFPYVDENGRRFVGGVGVDVTEEQAAAAKLASAQKLESLGLFAAGAAHDFNNLLTAIIGHAGLARLQSRDQPDLADHLRAIETAGEQMADLCQQMLSFAGRTRRDVRRVNLNNIVQDTVRVVRTLIPRSAAVRFDLAADLPALPADETQMRQVVMNLVLNAADALSENGGTITVQTGLEVFAAADPEPPKACVVLAVSDDGPGMTAAVRAKVFEPFFTTKPQGRGLGLAAVDGIVRSHGGVIAVESEPGRGTAFKVHLPLAAKPGEPR